MTEQKQPAKEHQVYYQLPLALALPFERKTDTVKGFKYEFSIPDADLEFQVITSKWVGPLFQTSQKTSVRIGTESHFRRQKVFGKFLSEVNIPKPEFDNYVSCHQNYFQALYAKSFHGAYLSLIPPEETTPKEITYANLKKQYLVTNDFIAKNFQTTLLASAAQKPKLTPKSNLNKVYLNTADDSFYILLHVSEPSHSTPLSKYAEELYELFYPTAETSISSAIEKKTSEAFLIVDMEVKSAAERMQRTKPVAEFLDNLPNKHNSSDILKGLAKMVTQASDRDWKQSPICVAIPVVKPTDFDYNYMEGCLNHHTNAELKNFPISQQRQQAVYLFSDCLVETPWDIKTFDSHLRIPTTLIQFQRMAQQFEYKQVMNFQFIDDHLMFKALSSRAQDPGNNNETLETLGDAALKALTIANLFVNNPKDDEGAMTVMKSKLVSNENLGFHVSKTVAVYYLKDKYNKVKHFVPPMLQATQPEEEDAMIIANKMLADCFEATVGAALVSTRRLYEPMLVIKKFGILPKFDLSTHKDWLEWQFPKDLEINYLVDNPLFNRDSPLGDVLSVSLCDDIFEIPPGILRRVKRDEELNYQKKFPLQDFTTGINKLQELRDSKQKLFHSDKDQHMARQQELLRIVQSEYLGYYFKNLELLSQVCSMSKDDKKQFERLELLGDAIIEVMGLYMARKIMLRLGKTMTPEILHSVKAVALSRHGLASIVIFHKLYYCLKLKKSDIGTDKAPGAVKLYEYLMKKHFNDKCRDVNWLEEEAAPKDLGDYLEALFGALFMDGGWEPAYNFFNRLFAPLIFFICKYFDDMVVDLIHDVNTFFATKGHQHSFATKKGVTGQYEVSYCVTLHGETKQRVIGQSTNKDESKARKLAAVQAQQWIKKELQDGKIDFTKKTK